MIALRNRVYVYRIKEIFRISNFELFRAKM
jgi:hypothetical protein